MTATTTRRPTLEEAYAQTCELLMRFDDRDFPPCCANCGEALDYQTTNMLCPDCALDVALALEDE